MLSTQEYLISWGVYLLSVLGLMVVWWRMSFWLRPPALRNVVRLSAAIALLTPYPVPGQEAFLAPALMMTFLEGLFFEAYGFKHAGIPLLMAVLIANIIYLVADLGWQMVKRKRQPVREEGVHQSTGAEPRDNESLVERKTPTLS